MTELEAAMGAFEQRTGCRVGGIPAGVIRDAPPSLFHEVGFATLGDHAKSRLAAEFLANNCSHPGAFSGTGDAHFYLQQSANEMARWPQNKGRAYRRLEHVSRALLGVSGFQVATSEVIFCASYLLLQLEYLFRQLSPSLEHGKFLSDDSRRETEALLHAAGYHVPRRGLPNKLNDVRMTYRVMMVSSKAIVRRILAALEPRLYAGPMADGRQISDIGERVAWFRHGVAHGSMPDPSFEGYFVALLVCTLIYGSDVFERI